MTTRVNVEDSDISQTREDTVHDTSDTKGPEPSDCWKRRAGWRRQVGRGLVPPTPCTEGPPRGASGCSVGGGSKHGPVSFTGRWEGRLGGKRPPWITIPVRGREGTFGAHGRFVAKIAVMSSWARFSPNPHAAHVTYVQIWYVNHTSTK